MDSKVFEPWIGRTRTLDAAIEADPARRLQATLSRDPTLVAGDELPPAWHWLYFHEPVRNDELGSEGHPKLGGFMPPIHFGEQKTPPRRMWAGGSIAFERPIHFGEQATRHSKIQSISSKEGKSGKLVFVIVEHIVSVDDMRCLREEQTIVYREPVNVGNRGTGAAAAATDAHFSAIYRPDPILLFRYSALTFNAHRIHYDVDYCRQVEGYPNLVVHGPLTATLLLDLFRRHCPDRHITAFSYRARTPLFAPHEFGVHGKTNGAAWATDHEGGVTMTAQVTLR